MEANILFEVLTKASLFFAGLVAFVVWAHAGFPVITITIKRN